MATAEEDDIAARFAAIVSPIASSMNWDPESAAGTLRSDADPEGAAERAAAAQAAAAQAETERVAREVRERELRRERRRAERARELVEYTAERAELEAAYNSDDDHFTPPPPPPLPRLRPATLGAVLMMVAGLALIVFPTLLVIDTQLTMVLGLMLLGGGAVTLVSRLRAHDDDLDGPNGAVL
ncbi:MAG: hypothetical protein ABJA16_14505 [Nakamurella sp.]